MSYVVEAPFLLPLAADRPDAPDAALIIRTPAIAEPYHALMVANQERLARWEAWATAPLMLDETRSHLAASAVKWADGVEVPTAIIVGGTDGWSLAGSIGLRINAYASSAQLGYWISAEHEGRGIVTRGARALLDQAFGPLGLARVEINAEVGNERSRAVAQRLGFVEEGILRQSVPTTGGRRDGVVYGLLAAEWQPN